VKWQHQSPGASGTYNPADNVTYFNSASSGPTMGSRGGLPRATLKLLTISLHEASATSASKKNPIGVQPRDDVLSPLLGEIVAGRPCS
jgi:hypothetical protein